MHLTNRSIRLLILLAVTALAACASAPPSTVFRTVYSPDPDMSGFSNILVVSVTGTYQSRAQFERELVMAMSSSEVAAAAYYTVLGRNPQLTRSNLHNAIFAAETLEKFLTGHAPPTIGLPIDVEQQNEVNVA